MSQLTRAQLAAQILAAYPSAGEWGALYVVDLADDMGADPGHLADLIQHESGWNPAAKNPNSSASGLIQFITTTADELGVTTSELRAMTVEEQLPYVRAYFELPRISKHWPLTNEWDLYLAVFYPGYIGLELDEVFPSDVTNVNRSRTPQDYVDAVRKSGKLGPLLSGAAAEARAAAGPFLFGLILVGLLAGIANAGRR